MDIFEYKIKSFRQLMLIIGAMFTWGWEDLKERPRWIALYVVAFFAAWWLFNILAGILWALFLMFLVYRWDNRVLGVLALVLLIMCPILLSLGLQAWAEFIAVYAFFFLVMTVALSVVELKRDLRQTDLTKHDA